MDIKISRISETWSMDMGLSRDLTFSSTGDPIENDRFIVNIRRKFSERLDARFSGSYSTAKSDSLFSRKESLNFKAQPSLHYKMTKDLALDLGYIYSYNENRLLERDRGVDRNIFSISLDYQYKEVL